MCVTDAKRPEAAAGEGTPTAGGQQRLAVEATRGAEHDVQGCPGDDPWGRVEAVSCEEREIHAEGLRRVA